MALDYRTPSPRKPSDTTTKFALFGEWTVQKLSPYKGQEGNWISHARRITRTAAIEWAMGHCSGMTVAATQLGLIGTGKSRAESGIEYEYVWVVGPDGHGYYCLEAPNLKSLKTT